jgi:hypothetical protein
MKIHQLSVKFILAQDRILMRINSREGQEWQMWLTRRLSLGLLPLLANKAQAQLNEQVQNKRENPEHDSGDALVNQRERLVESFQHEAGAYEADYTTPFAEPALKPIGDLPLLVTDIELDLIDSDLLSMHLIENLDGNSRNVQLSMDSQLSHGFLRLLMQAIQAASWMDVCNINMAVPQDAHRQALMDDGDKPKYLN